MFERKLTMHKKMVEQAETEDDHETKILVYRMGRSIEQMAEDLRVRSEQLRKETRGEEH